MWILVMLMVTAQGQMFQSHPKPMSQSECDIAKVAVETDLQTKLPDGIKATLRCVQWGPTEKSE
jgi:hypothetical protein